MGRRSREDDELIRKLTAALAEAERREHDRIVEMATLLDVMPVPVFIAHDRECLHLVGNRAAAELLGMVTGSEASLSAPDDSKPGRFRAFRDGKELPNEELPAKRAARGYLVKDFDFDLVFEDGSIRHVVGYGTPLTDQEGKHRGCVHVLIDVTGRKKAEEETQKLLLAAQGEREKLLSLINSIPDEVWFVDGDKNITLVNPAVTSEFGDTILEHPAIEAIAERLEVYRPAGTPRPLDEAPLLRALKGEIVRDEEEIIRTPATGQLRHRQANAQPVRDGKGNIIGSVAVVRDITERRVAEQDLLEAHCLLQDVMDGGPSAIFLKDREGRFITINAQLEKMLGMTREELRGKTDYDIAPREIADSSRAHDHEVMDTERPLQVEEFAEMKDGHHVFLANKFPLVSRSGDIYGVGAISHDITERKRLEEEVRESDRKQREILEALPNLVWTCTPDGKTDFVGRQWLHFTGAGEADQLGLGWLDCVHPEDRPVVMAAWDEALSTEAPYTIELRVRRHDGAYRWFSTTAVPIRDGSGRITKWIGSNADIDDRRRAEEALRRARDELELRVEERTQELTHKTQLLDTEYEAMEIIREMGERYIVGTDSQSLFQAVVDAAIAITRAEKGTMQVCDTSTNKLNTVAHRGLSDRFLQFFANIPEGERLCGSAMKEGKRIVVRDVSKNDLFRGKPSLKVLKAEGIRAAQSTPLVSRSGKFVGMLSTHFRNVHTPTEQQLRLLDILSRQAADIIERMHAEKEKARLEDQLRQSQKMEALGTLTGGIAHDFNNILAAILGFAEMCVEDAPQDSLLEKNLRHILSSSYRARDLILQMLTFSRKTEFDMAPLFLAPLVTETAKLLRASIPSFIEIDVRTPADSSCTVLGNATGVQQIIVNLCTNAAHAMEENGGRLTVMLSDVIVRPGSEWPDVLPGGYVELTVEDTGVGMDDETMKRMFDPFFTTKGPGRGTGMGLAVVYGLVKNFDGHIIAESRVGEGSTFRVLFPKAEQDTYPEHPGAGEAEGGNERILFVDDEEFVTEMAGAMLERLGYKVTCVTDSREALHLFSRNPSAFDLVITDQTMPHSTGLRLARELLKVRPGIPIILCTGYSESVNDETISAAGIKEYLMKPLARTELGAAVRRALGKKTA